MLRLSPVSVLTFSETHPCFIINTVYEFGKSVFNK